MNMLGFKHCHYILRLTILVGLTSCKKDGKEYVYRVNDIQVNQAGAEKPNVKTSTEYISIAYSDAFGANIPTSKLEELKKIYISFGDVAVTEDLIIRNFLGDGAADLPTEESMNNNPEQFVINAYKKIFNREPNEYEIWFVKDCIEKNSSITPLVVYYSLMTSNEYRQF